jgi:hypothetical protein
MRKNFQRQVQKEVVLARFMTLEHKTSQTTPNRLYKLRMPFMIDHRLKVA